MVSGKEAVRALEGVCRIAVFDRAGVSDFGRDLKACARSFWAYAFTLPATLLLIGLYLDSPRATSPMALAAAHLIGEIIKIAGFPLLMLPLLRFYGRIDRWAWFITGYNWFSAAQTTAVVTLLGLVAGTGLIGVGIDTVQIYFFVLEAFLAEAVLEIGAWRAILIVLVDAGFSFGIDWVADLIGGLS